MASAAATVGHLVELGMGVAIFDRDGDRAEVLVKELGERHGRGRR